MRMDHSENFLTIQNAISYIEKEKLILWNDEMMYWFTFSNKNENFIILKYYFT